MKQRMKVPEAFVPEKDLEKKIDELAKKIQNLEENKIIATKCCRHKDANIILNFDKEKPVGIICSQYDENKGTCYWDSNKRTCRYTLGFDSLHPDKEYKK